MSLLEDVPAGGTETGRRKPRARLGGGLLRGIRQRAGVSVGILLVATVAAAAAAAGPAYDAAARQSILRDAMNGPPITRSVEATEDGAVAGLSDSLSATVTNALDIQVGGDALSRDFTRPLQDVLSQVNIGSRTTPLTWHTDQCTHLKLTAGTCPQAAGQVMVSSSYARVSGLRPGDAVSTSSQYGRLTVTGVYTVPSAAELTSAYWLDGPCDDFAAEDSCARNSGGAGAPQWDAMFTPAATFTPRPPWNGPLAQGQATMWLVLAGDSVRPADLGPLANAAGYLATDTDLGAQNISVTSSIPQLAAQVTADWNALDVPVFLIVGQLLLLAWLLLFLIATDAAEARGPEVALAKLRGHGRLRTVAFGLSEPVLLLVAGWVAGTFAGWGAAAGLGGLLLRPGTATGLPALAVAAAAAAMLGGLVAVVAAARRALTRPVTEQWRRTARDATRRGWVLDAVLLTLAVAGLIELFTGGYVASARTGSLGLLVPGLLGLAAAVVASRLLPAACLLLAAVTRRRGGTAAFLAVRHIARRPGGTRTTIVLTAAFSLATFAIASYTVQHGNIGRVVAARTGAADVLTVNVPPGQDLGQIVDRVDPGGGAAVAVDRMAEGTGDGSVLLAVQPQRFARVAQWTDGTGPLSSPGAVAAALQPPAAPPVILPAAAIAVRVSVSGAAGMPPQGRLVLWVAEEGGPDGGETPVDLGPARDGTLTAQVSQCPCEVTMISVDTTASFHGTDTGGLTVTGLQAQAGGTWQPVTGALASAAGWQAGAEEPTGCDDPDAGETVTTGKLARVPGGLRWTFRTGAGCNPALHRQDVPAPLPVLMASALRAQPHAPRPAVGLDGRALTVTPAALIPAVPGAPATGIVVDRTYAQRAAHFDSSILVSEQVWVAPGADGVIRARLKDAGVTITGAQSTADAISLQLRQGPALAGVLFLASAAAAALLAAAAAVLGLYQAGRRRRYEYAALLAGRVPRRSLRSSVFIEQAVVLGFGVIAGVAAGLGAAALVLRNLPEFTVAPVAPPLTYAPSAAQLAVPVTAVIVALAVIAALAAAALVRSARAELLRETQP